MFIIVKTNLPLLPQPYETKQLLLSQSLRNLKSYVTIYRYRKNAKEHYTKKKTYSYAKKWLVGGWVLRYFHIPTYKIKWYNHKKRTKSQLLDPSKVERWLQRKWWSNCPQVISGTVSNPLKVELNKERIRYWQQSYG